MENAIKEGLRYFETIENDLVKKYENKFVVIAHDKVQGIYETDKEAYIQASRKFKEGTFLIRQCLKKRTPAVFHSRAYL